MCFNRLPDGKTIPKMFSFPSAKRPKLSKQFAPQTTQICTNFTIVALIRIITHRRKLAIRQHNQITHYLQMLQTLPYFSKRLLRCELSTNPWYLSSWLTFNNIYVPLYVQMIMTTLCIVIEIA